MDTHVHTLRFEPGLAPSSRQVQRFSSAALSLLVHEFALFRLMSIIFLSAQYAPNAWWTLTRLLSNHKTIALALTSCGFGCGTTIELITFLLVCLLNQSWCINQFTILQAERNTSCGVTIWSDWISTLIRMKMKPSVSKSKWYHFFRELVSSSTDLELTSSQHSQYWAIQKRTDRKISMHEHASTIALVCTLYLWSCERCTALVLFTTCCDSVIAVGHKWPWGVRCCVDMPLPHA